MKIMQCFKMFLGVKIMRKCYLCVACKNTLKFS